MILNVYVVCMCINIYIHRERERKLYRPNSLLLFWLCSRITLRYCTKSDPSGGEGTLRSNRLLSGVLSPVLLDRWRVVGFCLIPSDTKENQTVTKGTNLQSHEYSYLRGCCLDRRLSKPTSTLDPRC